MRKRKTLEGFQSVDVDMVYTYVDSTCNSMCYMNFMPALLGVPFAATECAW